MIPDASEHMPALARMLDRLGGPHDAGVTTEEAEDKLLQFVDLLLKWNRVYNLTAITDPAQILTHHLLDSLAVAGPLDALLSDQAGRTLLDVGSGAGLPGVPLAIVRPQWQLSLLDTNSKKTAFIQQAAAELGLRNVRVLTTRIESVSGAAFDVIISRAFSSLKEFIYRSRAALKSGGTWAAMKGTIPHSELAELPADIVCRDILSLDVPELAADRHLLFLKVKSA